VWCDVKLLDLILPVRCVVCAAPGEQLCPACLDALPRLRPPLCARCGKPTQWPVNRCGECAGRRLAFASARAAVAYDDQVRRLVRGWKERGLRTLAAVAAGAVANALQVPDVPALTFVPADRARGLERGYQPAERLARELGERWSLPVESLLGRTRPAGRQRGCHSPTGGATSPVRSPLRAGRRAASASSTTSTRAARPRMPPRARCAKAERAGSRW